jgi:dTDP-4-dehydrorhamnose reductase
VLITGKGGQVGTELLQLAPARIELRALNHRELDIGDAQAVEREVSAAAYTAVDRAEDEPAIAAAINTKGSRHLAGAARAVPGCRLLHISTDYVFDGRSATPYRPEDPTSPLGVYGSTKLDGELAVIDTLRERALVLRTAWVYAPHGKNFLLTILRLMRERGAVRVVGDQHGTPTAARSIAEVLWRIAQRRDMHGVWHWTDGGADTWHGFARAIGDEAHRLGLLPVSPAVEAITTADYPTRAHRPQYSKLDSSRTIERLQFAPAHWRENMKTTLAVLAAAPRHAS